MKIALMQPYFIPYAGYFRLFSATDLFVIYDDAQFPKGGWVHRNRLMNRNNELSWLTLPIKRQPLGITINQMVFLDNAQNRWDGQLRKFPALHGLPNGHPLKDVLQHLHASPMEFIINQLKLACNMLKIPFNVAYASEIAINNNIRGQDRVLEIVKHFGATTYLNSPGGHDLYDGEIFAHHGIKLEFLPDYKGSYASIAQRLLTEDTKNVRDEIDDF